ncbi:hypothetical protein VSR01_25980 [Actinacidiphila sp. DG2A-62]|uniref:hypothetical protein n=1 Tax=Actinacidiphila sp. DG2A-62 TaxID=3108821 RepID=UPI002DBF925E|nr:hypothetical protein [Actinacidiphila sp. DG2A-62]MEC3996770.1 hypothetical protein [Actinacidiphila sp. DG2A-62]
MSTAGGSLSLVVVLAIVTIMIVRSREVPWWQAALIFLFGFYVALTPAMYLVLVIVQSITGRL